MVLGASVTVLLLVLMCATFVVAPRVLLRPVLLAGKGQRAIGRFSVSDVGALTVYIAVAAGLTSLISDLIGDFLTGYVVAVTFLYALGTWYLGVQGLNAAGVQDTSRRLIYLGVATPAAYAGSMSIVVISVLAVWFTWFQTNNELRPEALIGRNAWLLCSVYALLWLGLVLAWQIARWVVRAPDDPGDGKLRQP